MNQFKAVEDVKFACTNMEKGQALFRSQVTEFITEHKLDSYKNNRDIVLDDK